MDRLFVAIDLPEVIQESIGRLYEDHRGVRWTPPGKLHLTLKFIGPADTWLEEAVAERLSRIEVQPFLLPLGTVGYFPPRGPAKVLWVGVGRGHPHLFQLQHRVENAFSGLPIELSARRWIPHITIARCEPSASEFVRQFVKKHQDFEGPLSEVESFKLMRSRPGAAASFYPTVAEFPLGAGVT